MRLGLRMSVLSLQITAAFFWARAARAQSGQVSFTDIGVLPIPTENSSTLLGVSADGSVAAGTNIESSYSPPSGSPSGRAIIWTASGGAQLLDRVGPYTIAYGISGDGSTIVGGDFSNLASPQAVAWNQQGEQQPLGDFIASAASFDGKVVAGTTIGPANNSWQTQAVRWTATGGIQLLGVPAGWTGTDASVISNDGNTIYGGLLSGVSGHGNIGMFRWTAANGLQAIGPSVGSSSTYQDMFISGITGDGGEIVGGAGTSTTTLAFAWGGTGGFHLLSGFPAQTFFSSAVGISGGGSIIVGQYAYWIDPGVAAANSSFFIGPDGVFHDLPDFLESHGVNLNGSIIDDPRAISADGTTIVGDDESPNGGPRHGFVATISGPLLGDATRDGVVNLADLVILSQNYGKAGGWANGDFDNDGVVGFDDLLILAQHHGRVQNPASMLDLPEPAGFYSMGLVLFTLFRRRRAARRREDANCLSRGCRPRTSW